MPKAKPRAKDIKLVMTCGACPEQYDAFYNGEMVGYLRLRHGHFTVDADRPWGVELYSARPKGDGCFEWDERDKYLRKARKAIAKHVRGE